jgi:hypothetical protein
MAARRGARVVAAAREVRHDGVPVSVTQILPAAIATPFFEQARTQLGVRPSGPPPVYPPEKVAEAILRSAQRPKRDIIVGGAAKAQLLAQKVSPRLVDAFASVAGVFLQKSNRPKQPSDGDALFEPPSGDDRERGEVSTGEPRGGT